MAPGTAGCPGYYPGSRCSDRSWSEPSVAVRASWVTRLAAVRASVTRRAAVRAWVTRRDRRRDCASSCLRHSRVMTRSSGGCSSGRGSLPSVSPRAGGEGTELCEGYQQIQTVQHRYVKK